MEIRMKIGFPPSYQKSIRLFSMLAPLVFILAACQPAAQLAVTYSHPGPKSYCRSH
jgi:hypothetical protein